jgi:uncharacterized coiled-coil protein SlyX
MELEEKVEVLEARIIELEKKDAFKEEESKDYVTKDEAKLVNCGIASSR